MLTIWGHENSVNVKKVLWCAAELDLTFNAIPAGGIHGKVKEPLFLSLNPNGLVPCLQDDENDLVLWESNTIVRYMAAKYGQSTWLLADASVRATAEKWMDWTLSSLAPALEPLLINAAQVKANPRDQKLINAGIKRCELLFDIAENALAKQSYFSGDGFGIGDIPIGCYAYHWFNMDIRRKPRTHLQHWYDAVSARPAFQSRVMIPLA
ncbi:glutathione S-transferase family protein [Sodalis sp. dw_96]|uniref:glutathione S-transferase family protein n=1 Tax=Sodalis sp. dw_96 TaxID=2719794 RepID=UPI001BD6471A|nr:glutathione S-transferase family protein [Sodalis sp. dw_96]